MDLHLSRLRRGEIIAGVGAVVLLALMFLIAWFRFGGAGGPHADGWNSLPKLRWLLVLTAAAALLLAYEQAARRAPALPVSLSAIATVLGALSTLALVIRLPTGDGTPTAGAFVGLAATAAVTYGGFLSLRQEDGWVPDADHPIERVTLGPSTPS
jgi:peptidoglycan/LPS O-acetylase OafA/YrhL